MNPSEVIGKKMLCQLVRKNKIRKPWEEYFSHTQNRVFWDVFAKWCSYSFFFIGDFIPNSFSAYLTPLAMDITRLFLKLSCIEKLVLRPRIVKTCVSVVHRRIFEQLMFDIVLKSIWTKLISRWLWIDKQSIKGYRFLMALPKSCYASQFIHGWKYSNMPSKKVFKLIFIS